MMGGPVIETIRPGVQFTPSAARAFRRAEAQVRALRGRDIDANSTYRDYDLQLSMWRAWEAYVAGRGPYPGHSKALHPADPLAFHTKGTALDSDDWTNPRVVQILAEHGFIRNRLHVPGEQHHFEYLIERDQHRNDPPPAEKPITELTQEDAMSLFLVTVPKAGTPVGDRKTFLCMPDPRAAADPDRFKPFIAFVVGPESHLDGLPVYGASESWTWSYAEKFISNINQS